MIHLTSQIKGAFQVVASKAVSIALFAKLEAPVYFTSQTVAPRLDTPVFAQLVLWDDLSVMLWDDGSRMMF